MDPPVKAQTNSAYAVANDLSAFTPAVSRSTAFLLSKRTIDIAAAITGLSFSVFTGLVLIILNPFLNPGPLLYKQTRMGQWGRPFTMWKFRSMAAPNGSEKRLPTDPLETERITKLGQFIRHSRIDELPNFFSVLTGDMALVGPRPDVWDHAQWFTENIRYYKYRAQIRPGITGLAQIRGGYADQIISINRKARYDYHYIRHASPMLDAYIIAKTVSVMFLGTGAK